MLQVIFEAWERRLASATTDRVVRPFEWGLDWIPQNGNRRVDPAAELIGEWVLQVMKNTDEFFTPPPTRDYALTARSATGDRTLTFPSAFPTPHRENNTVYARYFQARMKAPRAAVLVMPQWNADNDGHVGLCRLLTWSGLSALRLSLPYHPECALEAWRERKRQLRHRVRRRGAASVVHIGEVDADRLVPDAQFARPRLAGIAVDDPHHLRPSDLVYDDRPRHGSSLLRAAC